ncbi:MotA/TolQ/ExbB proton channel family protein [bacterium]|nr:MotA/TolQ/ExbB proton channel family protein [bacterium]
MIAELSYSHAIDTVSRVLAVSPVIDEQSAPHMMSFMDILTKGGIVMVPIGLISFIALYVFIERYLTIRRRVSSDVDFMNNIHDTILRGQTDTALSLCRRTTKPIARMIEKGITTIGRPIKEVEEAIEIVGKFEVYDLEKNIQTLAVIAGIAPMFGFLGTIIGVIKIFYNISMTSDVSIGTVSAGLYTKMVSSAAGLIVGIMAYIGYHWLNTLLNRAVHQLEWNAMNFIDLLKRPAE